MRSAFVPLAIAGSLLALPLVPSKACAEPYIGASLGIADQQLICAAGAPCDRRAPTGRLTAGWHFSERFGAELAWSGNLSDFTASDSLANLTWQGSFRVQALSASASWTLDAGPLDLQLRAGVASVRGVFHSRTAGVTDSKDTRTRPLFGAGLRRSFNEHWTLRADADLTDGQAFTRKGHHTTFTVGIERRF